MPANSNTPESHPPPPSPPPASPAAGPAGASAPSPGPPVLLTDSIPETACKKFKEDAEPYPEGVSRDYWRRRYNAADSRLGREKSTTGKKPSQMVNKAKRGTGRRDGATHEAAMSDLAKQLEEADSPTTKATEAGKRQAIRQTRHALSPELVQSLIRDFGVNLPPNGWQPEGS